MLTVESAKQLVDYLEQGRQENAHALVAQMAQSVDNSILQQVGELTRDLHEELKQMNIEQRMSEIAKEEIPDARERLQYVIDKTEDAANRTMDAVDISMPIADQLTEKLAQVRPQWNELMEGRIHLNEFKTLCYSIDALLSSAESDSATLRSQLTDILMAQDFQDLTGQIIGRVINLTNEVEERLVAIVTAFGSESAQNNEQKTAKEKVIEAEGPIINAELRDDAVSSQDDVDDLLSSLGF